MLLGAGARGGRTKGPAADAGGAEHLKGGRSRGRERQPPEDKPSSAEGRTRCGQGAALKLASPPKRLTPLRGRRTQEREAHRDAEGRMDAKRMRGREADAGTRGEQRDADRQRGHERLRAEMKPRPTSQNADTPESGFGRRLRRNQPKTSQAREWAAVSRARGGTKACLTSKKANASEQEAHAG